MPGGFSSTNITKKSETELPQILVDFELEKMIHELKDNISQMGLDFSVYLKNLKKTEDELKKEWLDKARERVRAALVLQKIADVENLDVTSRRPKKKLIKFYANTRTRKQ